MEILLFFSIVMLAYLSSSSEGVTGSGVVTSVLTIMYIIK